MTVVAEADPVVTVTRRERERSRECWTGKRAADLNTEQRGQAWSAGYEPGPDGCMVGRDPRTMTPAELLAMGHEPLSPMAVIRAKCLDCCGGSPHEVRLCVAATCPSWPFRLGKNPWRAAPSEEQLEAMRERGRRLADKTAAARSEADKSRPSAMEEALEVV